MALIPSRQLYFDSFQSSFSIFHRTPLYFLRYNSSIPLKPHTIYANSSKHKNPPRKSSFVAISNGVSQNSYKNVSLSNSDWLSKWKKPANKNHPKPPQEVLNYRTGKSNTGGSGSTMERIVEKLKRHGYMDDDGSEKKEKTGERVIEKGSVEDILFVEEGILPNAQGGFSKETPLGVESAFKSDGEVRFPWEKPRKVEDDEEGWTARSKSRTFLAEMTLPEQELKRLRNVMYQIKSKIRVKGAGVTQEIVNAIHERWKTSEVVKVKVEGPPALNMRWTHETLERKTGGLVIWRSGTSVALYRGVSYEVPSEQWNKKIIKRNGISTSSLPTASGKTIGGPSKLASYNQEHALQSYSETTAEAKGKTEIAMDVKYEDEVDKLLDGLGPRYTDWSGCDPLPVDADMLPGFVLGYQPPFRLLPYGVRSTLAQKEATSLRRLARFLPPHFALGRSRQLQGLAAAMVKLWEKSSIVKIALKRGVQLTTSERMAEDIKKLTGGMLLSRNKDFLVFYRGKDFLSPEVTEALLERERLAKSLQDEEEQARLRASALVTPGGESVDQPRSAGTLDETLDADARWGKKLDDHHKEKMMRQAKIVRHADLVKKLEKKFALTERKLMKAERALAKVEESLKPTDRQADPESITDEERYMFRKLGLRMKAFLLLGRRGVFDGTLENMHLHWKYRELVKIIVKSKNFEQVKKIALALEAESGGVLVSVDKISKGYAIIVYRGKDYKRPSKLRPGNLLTKRKALARSIEMQRHEALLKHVSTLETNVNRLRCEIDQMAAVEDHGDEELYDRLDSAYPTDDDDNEEEGNEAYLETYNSENDVQYDYITENSVHNAHAETVSPYDAQNEEFETEYEKEGDEAYLETYHSENGVDSDYDEMENKVRNVHEDSDYDEMENKVRNVHEETSFPCNLQNQEFKTEPEDGDESYESEYDDDDDDGDDDDVIESDNLDRNLPHTIQNQASERELGVNGRDA